MDYDELERKLSKIQRTEELMKSGVPVSKTSGSTVEKEMLEVMREMIANDRQESRKNTAILVATIVGVLVAAASVVVALISLNA